MQSIPLADITTSETDLHTPVGEPADYVEAPDDCESSSSTYDARGEPTIMRIHAQGPSIVATRRTNDGKVESILIPLSSGVAVPGVAVPATVPAASKSFNTIIGIANWFGVTPKTIYSWRKTDSSFAPRIGLAYRVPFSDPHYQKRAREFSSDK